jgi:magnesium transporter
LRLRQIHEYLSRPNCFVWVALHDPDPRELNEMQREFGLHPLAVEDARAGHQRRVVGHAKYSGVVCIELFDAVGRVTSQP